MLCLFSAKLIVLLTSTCAFSPNSNNRTTYTVEAEQLCPNLVESRKSTTWYQFHGEKVEWLSDVYSICHGCKFKAWFMSRNKTMEIIAVHGDYIEEWDFTGAGLCQNWIVIKLPTISWGDRRIIRCDIKPINVLQQPQGNYYNQTQSLEQINDDGLQLSFTIKNYSSDGKKEMKYIQIIFIYFNGEDCSLRVQEYTQSDNGPCSNYRTESRCGTYNCSVGIEPFKRPQDSNWSNFRKILRKTNHKSEQTPKAKSFEPIYNRNSPEQNGNREALRWFTMLFLVCIICCKFFKFLKEEDTQRERNTELSRMYTCNMGSTITPVPDVRPRGDIMDLDIAHSNIAVTPRPCSPSISFIEEGDVIEDEEVPAITSNLDLPPAYDTVADEDITFGPPSYKDACQLDNND